MQYEHSKIHLLNNTFHLTFLADYIPQFWYG
jgi:hypothetical protein